jgi:hypothetical protein
MLSMTVYTYVEKILQIAAFRALNITGVNYDGCSSET